MLHKNMKNFIKLNKITKDYSIKSEIFKAIQSEDFRSGSCGGCI